MKPSPVSNLLGIPLEMETFIPRFLTGIVLHGSSEKRIVPVVLESCESAKLIEVTDAELDFSRLFGRGEECR